MDGVFVMCLGSLSYSTYHLAASSWARLLCQLVNYVTQIRMQDVRQPATTAGAPVCLGASLGVFGSRVTTHKPQPQTIGRSESRDYELAWGTQNTQGCDRSASSVIQLNQFELFIN